MISFSRDGSLIATVAAGAKAIRIIEAATGHEFRTLQTGTTDAGARAEQAAFIKTIDSKMMARLHKRDITTPEQIIEAVEAIGAITSEKLQAGGAVSFSPDGRFLISNHVLLKNLLTEVWDAAAGTLVRSNYDGTLQNRGKPFFSPDGRFRAAPFFPMKDHYGISAADLLNLWGGEWKQILWQFGGNTFDVTPAETFFNEFYYPGLLAEVMAGKKPRAPKNISLLDRRQPELKLRPSPRVSVSPCLRVPCPA